MQVKRHVRLLVVVAMVALAIGVDVSPAFAATVPGVPTITSVEPGLNSATVNWEAPASDGGSPITGWTVESDDGVHSCGYQSYAELWRSCIVPTQQQGLTFHYRIKASNAVGSSPWSGWSGPVIPYDVPVPAPYATAPSVANAGDGAIAVSWYSGHFDPRNSPVTSVTVTASPGYTTCVVTPSGGATDQCVMSGLTPGVSYTFVVRASNAGGIGTSLPLSPAIVAKGRPSLQNVVATPGYVFTTVSWTPSTSNGGELIVGYDVTSSPGGKTCHADFDQPMSCGVLGLTLGTAYTFTVTSYNSIGTSQPSAPSAAVTPAGAPNYVPKPTVVAGNQSVTVTWVAPATNGAAITGYTVTSSPEGKTCSTSGALTCTVTGLTNYTNYQFVVTAASSAGPSSPTVYSDWVTPHTTPPGAPTSVGAVAGAGQAVVAWSAPASNGGSAITGYTVTSAPGSKTCSATYPTTTCTVTGLSNGTMYTFTVTAANANGSGQVSDAPPAVTPTTVPGKPTSVGAVAGAGQAVVSWSAPASNGGSVITGYTVTSSPGSKTCSATAPATTCTVTGLSNGTAYTFTVTAANANGSGQVSDASPAVTPTTVPGKPSGVTATAGDGQATVSWYEAQNDGGAQITGYTVTSSPGSKTCSTVATTCTVTGLSNGTAYTFTVKATNSVGTGAASDPSAAVTASGAPGKPTAVSAVAGDGAASVSWSAPASNGGSAITGYTVRSSPGSKTCAATPPTASCTVTGLSNGTAYTFTVKATNGNGTGSASDASPAVTPVPPAAPDPSAAPQTGPFVDVPVTHTFCEDIAWFSDGGFTTGYPDGTFRPTGQLTRQSVAAFLYRFADVVAYVPPATPTFSDVPTTHPFYKEIEWMAANGITGGYEGGTFRPTGTLTRQSIATFLFRLTLTTAQQDAYAAPTVAQFADVATTHPFAKAISWMVAQGYTTGYPGNLFKPSDPLTRQSVAVFLHRVADSPGYATILARY